MKKFVLVLVLVGAYLSTQEPIFVSACPQTIEILQKEKSTKTNEVLTLREQERNLEEQHKVAEQRVFMGVGELLNIDSMIKKIKAADAILKARAKEQSKNLVAVASPEEKPCENCDEKEPLKK